MMPPAAHEVDGRDRPKEESCRPLTAVLGLLEDKKLVFRLRVPHRAKEPVRPQRKKVSKKILAEMEKEKAVYAVHRSSLFQPEAALLHPPDYLRRGLNFLIGGTLLKGRYRIRRVFKKNHPRFSLHAADISQERLSRFPSEVHIYRRRERSIGVLNFPP